MSLFHISHFLITNITLLMFSKITEESTISSGVHFHVFIIF